MSAGLYSPLVFSRPGPEAALGAEAALGGEGAKAEPFLHPGKGACIATPAGDIVGWIGEVHPLVVQAYDLKGPAVAAELDLGPIGAASTDVLMFRDLLAFPVVEQDFALVVDAAISAAAVVTSLRAAGGELLKDIRVFDVYEGAQVAPGKKSLALRLSFRAPDRTLSEDEVNELRREMLDKVRGELGAELRA
jgi:phenylalanyl-tRNA synthetase beta chain